MVRSNLAVLILNRERAEGRKISYRVLAKEVGVSLGVITRLMNDFGAVERSTLALLCKYFKCQVGDILEYVPEEDETQGNETPGE